MMISGGWKTHSWVSQKRYRYDVNEDSPRFEECPG